MIVFKDKAVEHQLDVDCNARQPILVDKW